jgi:hypothetical protein
MQPLISPFPLFYPAMQIKPLLHCLTVLGVLALGGAQRACAQEDENWYQARLKKQRQLQQGPIVQGQQKQGATLQRSVCDLSNNGDMETQVRPPSSTGNMGGQLTMSNSPDELAHWFSPTYGTPDYQATNATFFDVNPQLEYGFSGSSTPRSGIGEIGLYNRQAYTESDGRDRDRTSEYATAPLNVTSRGLESARYYAEVWVSLSHATEPCNYGVQNGFGMWFTSSDGFKTLSNRDFLPIPTTQFISNTTPINQNAINYGNLGATTWKRISGQLTGNGEKFVTIGSFNSDPTNLVLLPGKNASRLNSYIYVDDFQLYKIPTAGPNAVADCGGTTIGEGCDIPGATYAWTIQGSTAAPFATTLQTPIRQQATTSYILTVTLPDGSTYATSTTVTGGNSAPAYPILALVDQNNCNLVQEYYITNFNSAYTYTLVSNTPSSLQAIGNPNYGVFKAKGKGTDPSRSFTLTVTGQCSTSIIVDVYFDACDDPTPTPYRTSASTAYPNPAVESLTVPENASQAVLTNSQGNVVQEASKAGQIDVHQLPNGLYNLRMQVNGKAVNQRIQIKH